MITTLPCDGGHHEDCPGQGLVQGTQTPPHEPDAEGVPAWVTVPCGCSCHRAGRCAPHGQTDCVTCLLAAVERDGAVRILASILARRSAIRQCDGQA